MMGLFTLRHCTCSTSSSIHSRMWKNSKYGGLHELESCSRLNAQERKHFKFPKKQLSEANPPHVKHLRWGVVIFSDLPPEGVNFQRTINSSSSSQRH
jgi:hypothetical protein